MDTSDQPKTLMRAVREAAHNYGLSTVLGIIVIWLIPSLLRCAFVYAVTICFVSSIIFRFVVKWRPRTKLSADGKAVFVTGCDSGFGHMIAQRLDDLGYHVFAGCLFPEGEGAQKLKKGASSRLQIVALDVTKDQSIQSALEFVKENLQENKLWAVVNNAGLNDGAEISWTNVDTIRRVLDVNTFGVVKVTKAFLPMIIQSRGRVVAVASAAGRATYPGMVAYCMSKQAVVSFCDGLRLEMYRWGVQVVTVEPWMYRTSITDRNTVLDYISKTWDKAPDEIKKTFPEDYLEAYKKSTLKILNYSTSENIGEVVSCLEEAVTAKNPRYSYNPGTLWSRLTFYIMQRLPKPISDLLIVATFQQR